MVRYTNDGGVISSGVPMTERRSAEQEGYSNFGIYRGIVLDTIYTDEHAKNSAGGDRIEFKIKVKGQIYPNAIDMRRRGGIFNYSERSRKGAEEAKSADNSESTYDELRDGEQVYVVFIDGNSDIPLIIGSADHPRHGEYKKSVTDDGLFDVDEFNGVEVKIDKDSNYSIKQVGRKSDQDGTIGNTDAVGGEVILSGIDGSVTYTSPEGSVLQISGTDGSFNFFQSTSSRIQVTADGSIVMANGSVISMDKTTGALSINQADGNVVALSETGITIADKSGNQIIDLQADDDKLQLTAGAEVLVKAQTVSIQAGAVDVGGSDDKGVLAGKLQALFDAHIHATTMGPSGPPMPPTTMALFDLTPVTAVTASKVNMKGNIG